MGFGSSDIPNPIPLREVSLAGVANPDQGELLFKDVGGRTEFFVEDDLGTQIQITSAGKINASPGGSDTYVQFNDGGVFGGDAGMVYDKTNDILTLAGKLIVPNVTGSVASGGTLALFSTSHATKGKVTVDTNTEITGNDITGVRNDGFPDFSISSKFGAMFFGTQDAKPIYFYTSDVERGRLLATGELLFGYTALSGQEQIGVKRNIAGASYFRIENTRATGADSAGFLCVNDVDIKGDFSVTTANWNLVEILASQVYLSASGANGLMLRTAISAPIYISTNATIRASFLGASATLQGNGGFTVQGGSAASNAITISSTSHATKGAVNLGDSGGTIGFYGVAAVARAGAYTQTYATAARTVADDTAADLATTAATQTTPWGFATQAQADNIATQFNLLRADTLALKKVVNALIDDLQAYGLAQ